jgi:hypothetical protein
MPTRRDKAAATLIQEIEKWKRDAVEIGNGFPGEHDRLRFQVQTSRLRGLLRTAFPTLDTYALGMFSTAQSRRLLDRWVSRAMDVVNTAGIAIETRCVTKPPKKPPLISVESRPSPFLEYGPVRLFGPDKGATVFGRSKRLESKDYDDVLHLVSSERYLSGAELAKGHGGILYRLAKLRMSDPDWKAAVRFPGGRMVAGKKAYGIDPDALDPQSEFQRQ